MSLNPRTFQSAGQISSHLIPGAYSRIDSVQGAAGLASASNGVVMGQCTGGKPTALLQFNTLTEAVATLRSGPLMEAVRLTFNPGGGLNPQRVFAMRVNNATQGTLQLQAGTSDMILVKSRDWGLYTNQIKVAVSNGSAEGKKVTVEFQSGTAEVFDDILRSSLTIQRSGTDAATCTVVNNAGTQTLTTKIGTGTTNAANLNIDLSAYPTIGELAAHINSQDGYTAAAVSGQENASSLHLDSVSNVDIKAPNTGTLQSSMQAMIDAINGGSVRISAEASNGTKSRKVVDNTNAAFLTGASEGAYTTTQWTEALKALEAENIQFVATPDGTSPVHAAIKTHCESMSSVTGRRERQFLVGAAEKTKVMSSEMDAAIAAAKELNSKNGMYVFNGGTQRDVNGALKKYGASYAACMLMGQKMALAVNQPLTFKQLNFIELEWKLSDTNLEKLLKNGVAAVNYSATGQPHLVRQFNTYQTNDIKFNEFSAVTGMFFASRDLRQSLERQFTGQPGTALTEGVLKGAVEARLQVYEELGIFIKNPATKQAWFNVQIVLKADQVFVDYDAYLTLPVNFMFVTNHFHELVANV